MSAATLAILTNTEVVAVDQDSLGQQGRLVATPATNLAGVVEDARRAPTRARWRC